MLISTPPGDTMGDTNLPHALGVDPHNKSDPECLSNAVQLFLKLIGRSDTPACRDHPIPNHRSAESDTSLPAELPASATPQA